MGGEGIRGQKPGQIGGRAGRGISGDHVHNELGSPPKLVEDFADLEGFGIVGGWGLYRYKEKTNTGSQGLDFGKRKTVLLDVGLNAHELAGVGVIGSKGLAR